MSLKLAIIGTSHVSSIVLAWSKIGSDFPDLDPTFFAAPGRNFRRLQINSSKHFGILDRSLFAPTEIKLLENTFDAVKIDLSGFDAVIHVGHNTLETELTELISGFSIDGLRENPGKPMLSPEAYESFAQALAERALLPELWQGWSSPRLFVLPAPRVAESCAKSKSSDYVTWRQLLGEAETRPVAGLFKDYTDRVTSCFAAQGIHMLAPPKQTISASGLTQAKFTKRALRLSDGRSYPSGDHKHMNEDYGLIVLKHICRSVLNEMAEVVAKNVPVPARAKTAKKARARTKVATKPSVPPQTAKKAVRKLRATKPRNAAAATPSPKASVPANRQGE